MTTDTDLTNSETGDADLERQALPAARPGGHEHPRKHGGGPGEEPKKPKHDVGHHHRKAAEHHERAARGHREAAKAHEAGAADAVSRHALAAFGHGAHAQSHAANALKAYAHWGE